MDAWVGLLLGIILGAIGTAFGFYIRDVTVAAERWGTSLQLDTAMAAEDDPWHGLEDVRVRVRPIYDFDKEKKA